MVRPEPRSISASTCHRQEPNAHGRILESAITDTRKLHDHQSDLSNPNSPSATVVVLRLNANMVESLVLADSTLVVALSSGEVTAICDDRLQRLKARLSAEGNPPPSGAAMTEYRNRRKGFWVAGARPEVAHQALEDAWYTDSTASAALLTDSAVRPDMSTCIEPLHGPPRSAYVQTTSRLQS